MIMNKFAILKGLEQIQFDIFYSSLLFILKVLFAVVFWALHNSVVCHLAQLKTE